MDTKTICQSIRDQKKQKQASHRNYGQSTQRDSLAVISQYSHKNNFTRIEGKIRVSRTELYVVEDFD
jgi:hypothetical protein